MRKLFSLGITVAVLVVMALTCPKEKDHYEAISSALADEAEVAKPLVKLFTDEGVKGMVKVSDYVLISIGKKQVRQREGHIRWRLRTCLRLLTCNE